MDTQLDYPFGANGTSPSAINNNGQIVGNYIDAVSGRSHGFLYSAGMYTTIDDPLGPYRTVGGGTAGGTRVTGLNDQGQIVGSFQDPYTITQHGFVYQNGVFDPIDLNGTTGVVVVGINDSDQVAGTFGSNTGSFLATVNPPPPLVLFYQQVLGRDPDSGGLAYSQSALAAGASLADLRAAIAHSQEAQNDLNAIYRQVLGRDADNGGAANYENALGGGFTLGAVRGDLAQSTEGQNDLNLIYRQVLGRDVDNTSGFFTYTRLLASGGSLQDVRSSVAHSNEARNDLNLIYRQVLGRDIDSSGLATYQNALAEGFSLVDVRLDVAHSAEAQNRLPQGVSMQGPQMIGPAAVRLGVSPPSPRTVATRL